MRRAAPIGVALVACLWLGAGCPKKPQKPQRPADSVRLTSAHEALTAWFECEECVDGELQAVLALGPKVVPALADALLSGPSVQDRLRVESELQLRYRELSSFANQTPDTLFTLDQSTFVQLYRANYVARIQGRAAWALAELDDPKAEQALRKGLRGDLRADVRQGVEAALKRRTTLRSVDRFPEARGCSDAHGEPGFERGDEPV